MLTENECPPATSEATLTLMEIKQRGAGIIYTGNFTVLARKKVANTFVRFNGFSKGDIWVNGLELEGWRITSYILPSSVFVVAKSTSKLAHFFQLESSTESCYVQKKTLNLITKETVTYR